MAIDEAPVYADADEAPVYVYADPEFQVSEVLLLREEGRPIRFRVDRTRTRTRTRTRARDGDDDAAVNTLRPTKKVALDSSASKNESTTSSDIKAGVNDASGTDGGSSIASTPVASPPALTNSEETTTAGTTAATVAPLAMASSPIASPLAITSFPATTPGAVAPPGIQASFPGAVESEIVTMGPPPSAPDVSPSTPPRPPAQSGRPSGSKRRQSRTFLEVMGLDDKGVASEGFLEGGGH